MKNVKFFLVMVILLTTTVALFSQSVERLEPVDVRSTSLGASYYTDTETLYSLYTNPAAIAFTGDKNLWMPLVSVVTGGELTNAMELVDIMTAGASETIDPTDADAINKYNTFLTDVQNFMGDDGYNASLKIGGPLTFGAIKNNFGWGFVNTIEIGAKMNIDGDLVNFDIPTSFEDIEDLLNSGSIPDLNGTDLETALTVPMVATLDLNTDFVLGYAVPVDLGILGELSIGLSARGISQFSFLYKDDIKAIFVDSDSFDPFGIPLSASFGVGFDMGVQYKFLDMVHVGLVWQDAYSPVWTNTYAGVAQIMGGEAGTGFNYSVLDSKLGLGASVDLPLEAITGNVISHSAVYANYKDFLQLVRNAQDGSLLYRDPLLDIAIGAEVVLFDVLAVRVGMNQLFPSGGLGLALGNFRMDASVHSEQLGYYGTDWRQLNFGLSITFQK